MSKSNWMRCLNCDEPVIIRDQCIHAGVPFFLKQLGGARNKRGGDNAVLDGRLWREMPLAWTAPGDSR